MRKNKKFRYKHKIEQLLTFQGRGNYADGVFFDEAWFQIEEFIILFAKDKIVEN